MTRPAIVRPLLALVASTVGVGCILFVSPDAHGDRCRFRGEETECGQCLHDRCSDEVDKACFTEEIIAEVEQCAAAGDDACNRLPASELGACLHVHCAPFCYARVGISKTRCTASFFAPNLACACELSDSAPTDLACNSAVYSRTRCCAPRAWPSTAIECTCDAVACFPSADGCSCSRTSNLDETAAEECRGEHCCALEDRCQCHPRTCTGAEREVSVCNKAEIDCPPNTVEVTSCAIRQ